MPFTPVNLPPGDDGSPERFDQPDPGDSSTSSDGEPPPVEKARRVRPGKGHSFGRSGEALTTQPVDPAGPLPSGQTLFDELETTGTDREAGPSEESFGTDPLAPRIWELDCSGRIFSDGQPTETVGVRLFSGLEKPLGYRVPEPMQVRMAVGCLVRVPVRNRAELGIVTTLEAPGDFPRNRLKYLFGLEQPEPVVTAELIALADWISRYYAAPLDACLEMMIPAAVRKGMRSKSRRMLRLRKMPEVEELAKLEKRAPRQAEVLLFLRQQVRAIARTALEARLKLSPSTLDGLVAKGWVEEFRQTEDRRAYEDPLAGEDREAMAAIIPELTDEQEAAVGELRGYLDSGAFGVNLLHGVTGSGKTEVYLRLLERTLEQGGGAIFLVPEIALAPQTVSRLRARLESAGIRTVVWHSHLSDGERRDAWQALVSGEARVVVGARSAIFAPVRGLRLVIVDEEHEPAYKQAEVPRYHGRDVAVYRARLNGALCLLGSATPCLESLFNVRRGKYRINHLTRRVDDRKLPLVHVVDMTREFKVEKGPGIFSRLLIEKLQDRQEKREQSILFLNRRGYSSSMLCPECGWLAQCEHCSVSLVYHRVREGLRCHLCGFERPAPFKCPSCGSKEVRRRGHGTQRVEELTGKLVPGAKVVRIDADAMGKKNLFRRILGDFRTGKIDILVGTQMIAKGLDFPNVTLVGLIDADISMHLPDFRAAERTFQLLVQVSGRAGRGDLSGEVVVQSYLPWGGPIQYARQGDFDGFLEQELEQRREFHYPPFRHLVHHLFRGRNPEKVLFFAEQWARRVEEAFPQLEVRGPAPSPVEKIKDHYRFQLWYFVGNVSRFVPLLTALRRSFPGDSDVVDVIDVDPMQLG